MMIRESAAHALPEPDFAQRGGEFVTTLWRDWLTPAVLGSLGLNERQRQAVQFAKGGEKLTNSEYQRLTSASRPTAIRDLDALVKVGVMHRHGVGRSTHYLLTPRNDSSATQVAAPGRPRK